MFLKKSRKFPVSLRKPIENPQHIFKEQLLVTLVVILNTKAHDSPLFVQYPTTLSRLPAAYSEPTSAQSTDSHFLQFIIGYRHSPPSALPPILSGQVCSSLEKGVQYSAATAINFTFSCSFTFTYAFCFTLSETVSFHFQQFSSPDPCNTGLQHLRCHRKKCSQQQMAKTAKFKMFFLVYAVLK